MTTKQDIIAAAAVAVFRTRQGRRPAIGNPSDEAVLGACSRSAEAALNATPLWELLKLWDALKEIDALPEEAYLDPEAINKLTDALCRKSEARITVGAILATLCLQAPQAPESEG